MLRLHSKKAFTVSNNDSTIWFSFESNLNKVQIKPEQSRSQSWTRSKSKLNKVEVEAEKVEVKAEQSRSESWTKSKSKLNKWTLDNDVPGEIVEVVHDDGDEQVQDQESAHDEET